jgi:hypothetical protein
VQRYNNFLIYASEKGRKMKNGDDFIHFAAENKRDSRVEVSL